MEITSSLLNEKEFKNTKQSIINISQIDSQEKFRTSLIEYINDTADNNDDTFFYDMLPVTRFLKPTDRAVAYTTPDGKIFLNAPSQEIGASKKVWDFIYCHECLHQLWDTFGVADKIKKTEGSYDHYILNIASDCVINDYLSFYRKKTAPDQGITPEYLQDNYGVDYDRTEDTQYTLYLKLMKVKDKLKQDQQIQQTLDDFGDNQQGGDPGGQQGGGQQGGDPGNKQGGGQGGDQQNSDIDNMSGQEAADAAQDAADKAQQAANNASKNGGDPEKAQKAADKAQDAADAAQDAADAGDDKTAREKAKEARNAAQEAENASKGNNQGKDGRDGTIDPAGPTDPKNKQGKDGQDGKDGTKDPGNKQGKDGKNSNNSSGSGQGKEDIDTGDQTYDSSVRDFVDSIVDKYKNSITGILGKFTEQCRQSVACNKQGIKVQAQRAGTGWDKKLKSKITAYVKEKIFNKQRMFKKSFSRPNRRQGIVKFDGSPLNPGKKKVEQLLLVDLAFYIDKSGSMGNNIENVFDAYENIAMAVTKLCKGNAVVKDINYRTFIFDTQIKEIKFGQRSHSGGNTCDFEDLLNYISKNTKDILINCIITDADFGVNASEARKFFDESQGLVIVVTNNPNQTLKNLSNETKLKTKFIYIEANSDFSLS